MDQPTPINLTGSDETSETPENLDHFVTVKVRRPGGRFIAGRCLSTDTQGLVIELPAGISLHPGEGVEVVFSGPTAPAVVHSSQLKWARVLRRLSFQESVHIALRYDMTPGMAKAG